MHFILCSGASGESFETVEFIEVRTEAAEALKRNVSHG